MFNSWHVKYALLMSGLFAVTVGYNACSEDAKFDLSSGVESFDGINDSQSIETKHEAEPSLLINNDSEYTRDASVNLTLDPDGPADEMLISDSNDCSVGSWEPYQTNKIWTLQQLNQNATVFVKYRFEDDPESECVSDSIIHDNIPPAIQFTQGVSSLWIKETSLSISYSVTDFGSGVQEIQCDRNGSGNFQSCGNNVFYNNLTENTNYLLLVRALDKAGNMADPKQLNWRPDYTPPSVTFNSTPAAVTADVTPDFSFTGTDLGSGIAKYECQLDKGVFAVCDSPKTFSGLADGNHTLTLRAIDGVGHVSTPISYTWQQDTMAPTIEFTQTPMPIEKTGTANFTFRVVAGDIASYQCQLDAGAYQVCTSPQSLSALADGNHTFSVIGVDGVGNLSSPISYSWLVDTMPPTIAFVETPKLVENKDSATFGFSAQDAGSGVAKIECRLDSGAFAACGTSMTFNTLAAGNHTLEAHAVDRAGNLSANISYSWSIDYQPPVVAITSHPLNPTKESLANFEFTATDSGSGIKQVECKIDGMPYATCTSPVAFNGLAEGQHIFSLRAMDNAGNLSVPATYQWLVDMTAPTLDFISRPNSIVYVGSTPKVSFTANDGNGSGIASYTCLYNSNPVTCQPQTAYDYPATQEGSHSFMVTVVDNVGNQTSISTSWTVEYLISDYSTTYKVRDERPVDILFIVDNSGSMDEERENLGQRLHGLLNEIGNLDWQIAVTSTDVGADKDWAKGRISDFSGSGLYILDPSLDRTTAQQLFENKLTDYDKNKNKYGIGGGSGDEQGIYAMSLVIDRALNPDVENNNRNAAFIRPDADFVAVILSDENEYSKGADDKVKYQPQEFLDRFNAQYDNQKKFTFHSIVVMSGDEACLNAGSDPHYYGTLYEDLSKLTGFGQPGGGTIGSVCSNDYTTQLADIGKSVQDLAKTVNLQCAPLDNDNDGKPDVAVMFKANGTTDFVPFTEAYTIQGQQIAYQNYLPVGDYKFDYKCVGAPAN